MGGRVRSGRGAGPAGGGRGPLLSRWHRVPVRGWRSPLGIFAPRMGRRWIRVLMRWRARCVSTIRAPTCSAAFGCVWAVGAPREATLACLCGREDCTAVAERKSAAVAVIHVLAEQAPLDGTSDAPGYLRGFGIHARRIGAQGRQVGQTQAAAGAHRVPPPDPGYRPTAATTEFVQWRDLTCRWPGCDKPAEYSDIDHTVPWPCGPTHPSNNKCYCRTHHLIKTFGGWADQQLPDGTIILTAPTGLVYTHRTPWGGDVPDAGSVDGGVGPARDTRAARPTGRR